MNPFLPLYEAQHRNMRAARELETDAGIREAYDAACGALASLIYKMGVRDGVHICVGYEGRDGVDGSIQ